MKQFNIQVLRTFSLGGGYYPSNGITPEIVYPFLAEISAKEIRSSTFIWVELQDLIKHRRLIRDSHLLISLLRSAHALNKIH